MSRRYSYSEVPPLGPRDSSDHDQGRGDQDHSTSIMFERTTTPPSLTRTSLSGSSSPASNPPPSASHHYAPHTGRTTPKPDSISITNPGLKSQGFDWAGSWVWEVGAAILSVISIGLLVGFLAYISGSAYDNWQYTVSPNTIVSILSTVGKTAMLVPVSACIGQLKWHKYKKPTPLSHMHVLDQASRGPWGSLELLWSIAPGLATFGAVLTILSLAMDPFAQQMISIRSRSVLALNETAFVQKTENYYSTDNGNPGSTQFAILSGLFQTNTPLKPNCETNFCTYPEFVTLGFCSRCEDVTHLINQTCTNFDIDYSTIWGEKTEQATSFIDHVGKILNNCTYTAPLGIQFNNANFSFTSPGAPIPTLDDLRGNLTTVEITHRDAIFANAWVKEIFDIEFPVVTSSSTHWDKPSIYTATNLSTWEQKPNIAQCGIYLCEREYSKADSNNPARLQRTQPLMQTERVVEPRQSTLHPPSGLKPLSANASYMLIDTSSLLALAYKLRSVLSTGSDAAKAFETDALATDLDLSDKLDSLATSLTDLIRNINDTTTIKVPGQAFRKESYIHVRWPYIILPVAIVILSTVLLMATVISGRRFYSVLWKNSVLPLVVARLENDNHLGVLRNVDELQRQSRKVKVFVDDYDDGIAFKEQ